MTPAARDMDLLGDLLEVVGGDDDRFTARPPGDGFLFGGLTMGLTFRAAATTVADGLQPKSMHTLFLRGGRWGPELELAVDRLSDSRAFSTRSVLLSQFGQTIATSLVSFHVPDEGRDWHEPAPSVPPPESLEGVVVNFGSDASPIQVRSVFPRPISQGETVHPYWAKPRYPLPDEPFLAPSALAFVSDYMVIYSPFARDTGEGQHVMSRTLEHVLWFHRPVSFDDWLLFSCEPTSVTGGRFVSRGHVHDRAGSLIASFAQEGLIRPISERV